MVSQTLVLKDGQYSDTDNDLLRYQVIGKTNVAFHLVNAAGGAISSFAIEVADGSMLKVSSATFGGVTPLRGKCTW